MTDPTVPRPFTLTFPDRSPTAIAITNVSVVPMDSPRTLPSRTVVIEDGRIRSIAPADQPIPPDAEEIDGRGQFLMPGLADMHVHFLDATDSALFLANGVTLVRNMWGAPVHLAWQRHIETREMPGPRLVTTSPIIDGPGPDGRPSWPGSTLLADPEDAEMVVTRFAARGYQQIKAYSFLTVECLHALGAAAKKAELPLTGHCPANVTYEEAMAAGMTCFEHLTGIAQGHLRADKQMPDMRHHRRLVDIQALRSIAENLDLEAIRSLAGEMAVAHVWNCPTIVVYEQMAQPPSTALDDDRLRFESPARIRSWDPANDHRLRNMTTSHKEWLAAARARNSALRKVVSILHEEGAPMLLGTDTPNPFVFQGFSVHQELANLVDVGLSPYEALRCATAEAARFLEEDADWGTIKVGKRADLLLVGSNPLDDVSAVGEQLQAVFVNGFHLSRDDLDDLLAQRESAANLDEEPPSPELEAVARDDPVDRRGSLTEHLADSAIGRLTYRHRVLADGQRLVEERYVNSLERLRRTSRLRLTRHHEVIEICTIEETAFGEESIKVTWRVDDACYDIVLDHVDGHRTRARHDSPMILPSERLAFTVIPLVLAERPDQERSLATLSIRDAEISTVQMTLLPAARTQQASDTDDPIAREVSIERSGQSTRLNYRITPDGTLQAMYETTPSGQRELLAERGST